MNIWELQVYLCSWLCLYVMETPPEFHNIMTLDADIFNSQENLNSMKRHTNNRMKIKILNKLQAQETRRYKLCLYVMETPPEFHNIDTECWYF